MITGKILEAVKPFDNYDSPYYILEHCYRGFACSVNEEYEASVEILVEAGFLKRDAKANQYGHHQGLNLDQTDAYFNYLKSCDWREIPLAKPSLYKETFGWPMDELISGLSVPVPGQETTQQDRGGIPGDLVNLGLLEACPLKIIYPEHIPPWLTERQYQTSLRGQQLLDEYFHRYPKESAIRVIYGWDFGSNFSQFGRALRYMRSRVPMEVWQEIINEIRKIDPQKSLAFSYSKWVGPFTPTRIDAGEDEYLRAIQDAVANPKKYAPRPILRNLNPEQLQDLAQEIKKCYSGLDEPRQKLTFHPQNP